MKEVKLLTDYELWDNFVEQSPQGTIFCTTKWMQLFDAPFKIYGYYKNGNLVGGIAGFEKPMPLTPFQGILVQDMPNTKYANVMSIHNEIATALLDVVPREFCNHYTFPDIRPFLWAGWQSYIRYTYVIDLSDSEGLWLELEKDTRNLIRKYEGLELKCLPFTGDFIKLYGETFSRKGLEQPIPSEVIQRIKDTFDGDTYMTHDGSAGAITIRDNKRSYYILGASDGSGTSSYLVWQMLQAEAKVRPEIDLVGCNDQKIASFKKDFGGKLMPYYGVRRVV